MTEPMLTPGPWEVDENGNVVAPEQIEDGHPVVVAEIYERPDGHLIAAAPDLLRALESLTRRVGFEDENKFRRAIVHGGVEHRPKSPCAVCEAIAKASGKAE